jgi:integrase
VAAKLDIYNHSLQLGKDNVWSWQIPESEKRHLIRFIDELGLGMVNRGKRLSQARQLKYLAVLKIPLEFFDKPATQLTLSHIEAFERVLGTGELLSGRGTPFAHATKVDIRNALQVYLRWRLGEDRARKLTSWLDTRDIKKTPDFLKEAQVEKLLKACKSADERYLIAVLFDAGARATEFHNIRYEDIELTEGQENFVRLSLKQEYSKTKGRTISLYWKHSREAVRDFLKEREMEGITAVEPVFNKTYAAARLFLHRLGKKVLGRAIHYHLFRHSSATYYADKMNRQQLCIRYGWTFSSNMPDIYIARAGVDTKDLDQKFTSTTLEELRRKLERKEEDERIKTDRIRLLESEVGTMRDNFQLLVQLLAQNPSLQEIQTALSKVGEGKVSVGRQDQFNSVLPYVHSEHESHPRPLSAPRKDKSRNPEQGVWA